jgi:hypothetical protein
MHSHSIKSAFIKLEESVVKLSNLGWTIPPYLTPREAQELLQLGNVKELDDFFDGFYSEDEEKEFNRLAADLLRNRHLDKWRPLIRECIDAYRRKNHIVTIPSLLTIIEGAIAQIFGASGIRIIQLCNNKYSEYDEGSVKRVVWKSIHSFVSNIFTKQNFDEERLELINRHWILHGRDVLTWTKADSLRLFQALHTLGLVTNIREELKIYDDSDFEEDSNFT